MNVLRLVHFNGNAMYITHKSPDDITSKTDKEFIKFLIQNPKKENIYIKEVFYEDLISNFDDIHRFECLWHNWFDELDLDEAFKMLFLNYGELI